jgi:hypothetical protein
MVFNATFNNISVISVLLMEEIGVPGENHRVVASHWQTFLKLWNFEVFVGVDDVVVNSLLFPFSLCVYCCMNISSSSAFVLFRIYIKWANVFLKTFKMII